MVDPSTDRQQSNRFERASKAADDPHDQQQGLGEFPDSGYDLAISNAFPATINETAVGNVPISDSLYPAK